MDHRQRRDYVLVCYISSILLEVSEWRTGKSQSNGTTPIYPCQSNHNRDIDITITTDRQLDFLTYPNPHFNPFITVQCTSFGRSFGRNQSHQSRINEFERMHSCSITRFYPWQGRYPCTLSSIQTNVADERFVRTNNHLPLSYNTLETDILHYQLHLTNISSHTPYLLYT